MQAELLPLYVYSFEGCIPGATMKATNVAAERIGECLRPTEKLRVGEISRRLALTQLLWAESERNMVEQVRIFPQGAK
jgi:hypothetical protein